MMKCVLDILKYVTVLTIMTCCTVSGLHSLSENYRNQDARMVSPNVHYNDELRPNLRLGQSEQIIPNHNEPIDSRNESPSPASNGNSTDKVFTEIDESLIINFLKTYKHINAATLLMCSEDEHLTKYTTFDHLTPDGNWSNASTGPNTNCKSATVKRQRRSSSFKFFVYVWKLMMAKGILIKASDIDGAMFRNNANGPEVLNTKWDDDDVDHNGLPCYEEVGQLPTNASSSRQLNPNDGTWGGRINIGTDGEILKLMNLLKSSVFHYGVVLDLSCRQSGWVLQQVSS